MQSWDGFVELGKLKKGTNGMMKWLGKRKAGLNLVRLTQNIVADQSFVDIRKRKIEWRVIRWSCHRRR